MTVIHHNVHNKKANKSLNKDAYGSQAMIIIRKCAMSDDGSLVNHPVILEFVFFYIYIFPSLNEVDLPAFASVQILHLFPLPERKKVLLVKVSKAFLKFDLGLLKMKTGSIESGKIWK